MKRFNKGSGPSKRTGTEVDDGSLAEDVLRDAGKSEDEIQRTGKIDRLDDDSDLLYGEKQRTANSPVHRLVWRRSPLKNFFTNPLKPEAGPDRTEAAALKSILDNRKAGTLYDGNGKVSVKTIDDLAKGGYWGMLIDTKYGGQGASVRKFMNMITQLAAKGDATVAGLASIHGCIGAVDPVRTFGNEEQKAKFLPQLASGKTISAFALTEPGAGSDLTALKTTAVLDGDHYVVNGEKLFISNAVPGRTIGLVCLINGKPSVLIAELPAEENEQFQTVPYGIHAIKHGFNNGLKFKNFRVPKENLLSAPAGNGLIIPYHGLNYGRVALCANAAGVMRQLLQSMIIWARYRDTYGAAIETRELVHKRVARLAGMIVAADALTGWGASILDNGFRGELECIVAKIFGSEAQKEAAIDLAMKTHGGRSFLHGNIIGDNIHDFLAPCIYEGEGEMLLMAFFKSLAKEHGMSFMLPLGEAVKDLKKLKLFSAVPGLLFHGARYGAWRVGKHLRRAMADFGFGYKQRVPGMDKRLQRHLNFALKMFTELSIELSNAMIKHQVKLADRQNRIAFMSQRVHDALVILVTSIYAHQSGDAATIAAADILCQDITRKVTGAKPSDAYFAACSKVAEMVFAGQFKQLEGTTEAEAAILRPYKA